MKRFFKIILVLGGLVFLGLVIFVTLRIRENDEKAAVRQAEAEKIQVSPAEAQQLDLGGFLESDFRLLPTPVAGTAAPTPEQWRGLRQGLTVAPTLAALLPERAPVVASGFGPLRYAVRPEGWRVLLACRPEAKGCAPVALAATALNAEELAAWNENINTLATEGTAVYGALHGRKGTEGMDKLIKEGNVSMIYNEFCSELGCNGSVSFAAGAAMLKVEGSGDLQPWFAALVMTAGQGIKQGVKL
jgi:hypothetical protein